MNIIPDNFFKGGVYQDSFYHGKCSDRPIGYHKIENGQRLNLPPLPHKRFNKIPDRTYFRNDMQFGDGTTWTTFPVMKLTPHGWGCDYDGNAMYGNCGNKANLDISETLSVTCGIMLSSETSAAALQTLIGKYTTAGSNRSWVIAVSNENIANKDNMYIFLGKPSDGTFAYRGYYDYELAINILYYGGFTFSRGTLKLYVNGENVSLTTGSGTIPSSLYITSQGIEIGKVIAIYAHAVIHSQNIYAHAQTSAKQKDDYWRYA